MQCDSCGSEYTRVHRAYMQRRQRAYFHSNCVVPFGGVGKNTVDRIERTISVQSSRKHIVHTSIRAVNHCDLYLFFLLLYIANSTGRGQAKWQLDAVQHPIRGWRCFQRHLISVHGSVRLVVQRDF